MSHTIVLVHGAWLNASCWDLWKARYEAQGHTVVAKSWPYDEKPVAELKEHSDPELGHLSVRQIVDHYSAIIEALPESPIIIGHSAGGLFTQLLANKGYGLAAVALDPIAPAGIPPGPQQIISSLGVFGTWDGWNKALTMPFEVFANRFAQTLPEDQKQAMYDQFIIPTPGRLYWQGALMQDIHVDYANPNRPPLCLVSAEKSLIVDPSVVKQEYEHHRKSPVFTDFKSFAGRSHFLCQEPGWEDVCDFSLSWALEHQRTPVAV